MNRKVTVFGAGFVGSTTGQRIAEKELADVTMIDIIEGMPQGKALDMMESAMLEGFDAKVTGSNDPAAVAGSDLVVITSGIARKPGMSRDDLLKTNAGIKVEDLIPKDKLDAMVTRTRNGGIEIVNLLKTGSAYYAPSSSVVEMVRAILHDEKRVLPAAAWCTGQYGVKDMFVGVPAVLGANGVEKIIELKLTADELGQLKKSADHVLENVKRLNL